MIMTDQATVTRVEEVVAARSDGAFLSGTQPHADTLHFTIEKRAMRAVVEGLVNELQARFMISVGTDTRSVTGDFAILHLFSLDREHLYVLLESPVSEEDLRIESITESHPGGKLGGAGIPRCHWSASRRASGSTPPAFGRRLAGRRLPPAKGFSL